ncbi:MAG: RCC1 domain-containing protein [Candidatus Ratteibacteria bacterium]
MALKEDGTLWAWGYNLHGQLGLGNTDNTDTPTQVGAATDWLDISAGSLHTIALKEDGTLWAWGYNYYGQLGLNDSGSGTERTIPTQVGTATNWYAISAGSSHTIALKEDGTLWAWGFNHYGQLGLDDSGSGTDRATPTQVGTDTDWLAISAGDNHTIALKEDGTLWAWGHNSSGQLGLDDTTKRVTPTQVGTDTNWLAISGGSTHTIALKEDGTLWAWGGNYYGQLGLGDSDTGTDRTIPTQVGTATNWYAISAGDDHTIALKEYGTLWAWGNNSNGQLGLGNTDNTDTPTLVN